MVVQIGSHRGAIEQRLDGLGSALEAVTLDGVGERLKQLTRAGFAGARAVDEDEVELRTQAAERVEFL